MQNEDFATEYYKNFDIDIFCKKLEEIKKKLSTLKRERSRKVYYTELYATYLQIVEIFCINSFAISDKDLASNIFLSNRAIEKKIESRFYSQHNEKGQTFVEYIVHELVFNLIADKKNRDKEKRNYVRLTKEAVDDYLKDKDFLNSYKHGFRVVSGEKSSLLIGVTGGKNMSKIADYSSSVSYYRQDKSTSAVLKCDISFNWERVYVKLSVLLNILENMRRMYLSDTKDDIQTLTFDNTVIDPKYGCFRTCKEVA